MKMPSLHPSICLDTPAFGASLGSVTDTLNYNCDCAYVNEFLSRLKTSKVCTLRATAQEAIGLEEGA